MLREGNNSADGTDVDFGSVTRQLFAHRSGTGEQVNLNEEVRDLWQETGGTWSLAG